MDIVLALEQTLRLSVSLVGEVLRAMDFARGEGDREPETQ